VIDCSAPASADPDFLLTADYLRIGKRARANPAAVLGADAHGLVEAHRSRRIQNYDETDSTRRGLQPMRSGFWSTIEMSWIRLRSDRHRCRAGVSPEASLSVPLLHARRGRYGLQCLTNLDLLPPTGAVIFARRSRSRTGRAVRFGRWRSCRLRQSGGGANPSAYWSYL